MHKAEIRGLYFDPKSGAPIVVLIVRDRSLIVPICVGPFEANMIALGLEQILLPRPMTHDLMRAMIEQIGGVIVRVVVSDLRVSTFYATIVVQADGSERAIDARPSDAIALALRCGAPILVDDKVLEAAGRPADLEELLGAGVVANDSDLPS
jgi:bifunctional DNase/RNase